VTIKKPNFENSNSWGIVTRGKIPEAKLLTAVRIHQTKIFSLSHPNAHCAFLKKKGVQNCRKRAVEEKATIFVPIVHRLRSLQQKKQIVSCYSLGSGQAAGTSDSEESSATEGCMWKLGKSILWVWVTVSCAASWEPPFSGCERPAPADDLRGFLGIARK
jgi:hypothetical protein